MMNRQVELNEYVKIRVGEQFLKQSRPQKYFNEIYFEKFEDNPNICVVNETLF